MIVVGGMIGLGKTTIAEKLSESLNSKVFYESVDDNKILPLFYKAGPEECAKYRYPFLLQLEFLNSRFSAIKKALQDDNDVMDRSIYEDWYFAKKNEELGRISEIEMSIYERLLNNMMQELDGLPKKAPDIMVYLKGSFETVINHINSRGRAFELGDELISYYRFLWEGYDDWVYNCYKASPVITIDMDKIDVVNHPQDWEKVWSEVQFALKKAKDYSPVDFSSALKPKKVN